MEAAYESHATEDRVPVIANKHNPSQTRDTKDEMDLLHSEQQVFADDDGDILLFIIRYELNG